MALELARRSEFAQTVSNHVSDDGDRRVLAAVVDADRVTDHLRSDDGRTRPRLDDGLVARFYLGEFLEEFGIRERTLLQ